MIIYHFVVKVVGLNRNRSFLLYTWSDGSDVKDVFRKVVCDSILLLDSRSWLTVRFLEAAELSHPAVFVSNACRKIKGLVLIGQKIGGF